MKIIIDDSNTIRLEDAEIFGKFKIVVPRTLLGSEHFARQMASLGEVDEDGKHVWVYISQFLAIFGVDRSDSWHESFEKMIEIAAKYGFINAERTAFRSHMDIL